MHLREYGKNVEKKTKNYTIEESFTKLG